MGSSAGDTLAWATEVATEAEEIINSTLLMSVATTATPYKYGDAALAQSENGWYFGIERDRKLVSQLDKLTFKMGRGGGWVKGLEYRSRLVSTGQWRGAEPTPSLDWGEDEQVA